MSQPYRSNSHHDKPEFLVENVKSADGKGESGLVFTTIAMVLLVCGSLLYWLYNNNHHQHAVVVPGELRQHLTALSIAADELQLIRDLTGTIPELSELESDGVSPFASDQQSFLPKVEWQQLKQCFLGQIELQGQFYQLRMLIGDTEETVIGWRIQQVESLQQACSIDKANQWHRLSHASHH